MSNWLRGLLADIESIGQVFGLLWKNKHWWLIPMVVLLFTIGVLLIFATATGVAPLIYTLF